MAGNMDASYIYLSYGKEKYMISVPCYFLFPVEHAHSNIYICYYCSEKLRLYFQFLNTTLINKDHILMY